MKSEWLKRLERERKEIIEKAPSRREVKRILEEDAEVALIAIKLRTRAEIFERCSQNLKEGHEYMEQGDYEKAIFYFERALEGYKKVLKINSQLAGFKKAKQILKTDFSNDKVAIPDLAKALHSKGDALEKLGKHREASKCYKKALEIEPNLIKTEIIEMIDEALEEKE